MRSRWEDVNARARGLGAHLLGAEALASLAESPDLAALARGLESHGLLPGELPAVTAPALELALRRHAAQEVRIIRRWLGPRDEVVAVALDAEDRRSLRALVRGAAAGAGADARLSGLIPTPSLPERLLEELATRPSIREQAALLLAAGHPAGAPLLAAASVHAEPDLFAIELALSRSFADRALRGAGRQGGMLLVYVGTLVDLENCRSALWLVRRGAGEPAAPAFLAGGRRLAAEAFVRAVAAPEPAAAARVLGVALGGGTLALLLRRHADDPVALEHALELELLGWVRQHARLDPLGPAPLLHFFLRLRQQADTLGRLVWSVDLGAPAGTRLRAAGAAP
jgi:vacuolar-type H+-ATPase subunit C/Vma6